MSSSAGSGKPLGAVNVQRRTWDKDEFEKRAKERAEREESEEAAGASAGRGSATDSVSRPAPPGLKGPEGSERAFLQAREYSLNLEAKLNKRRVRPVSTVVATLPALVTSRCPCFRTRNRRSLTGVESPNSVLHLQLVTDATPISQVGGFWCDVCECTLRDSVTYMDHINGKNHQKKLGFTMRVEKSSLDEVKARLAAAKDKEQKAKEKAEADARKKELYDEYDARIAARDEEDKRKKKMKRERERGQDEAAGAGSASASSSAGAAGPLPPTQPAAGDAGGAEEMDPALAEMLGFGGFGGGKKR